MIGLATSPITPHAYIPLQLLPAAAAEYLATLSAIPTHLDATTIASAVVLANALHVTALAHAAIVAAHAAALSQLWAAAALADAEAVFRALTNPAITEPTSDARHDALSVVPANQTYYLSAATTVMAYSGAVRDLALVRPPY